MQRQVDDRPAKNRSEVSVLPAFLLIFVVNFLQIPMDQYDIAVKDKDGTTYYRYINDRKELEVVRGDYSGTVNIRSRFTAKIPSQK